jgi:hypothetical protein
MKLLFLKKKLSIALVKAGNLIGLANTQNKFAMKNLLSHPKINKLKELRLKNTVGR